MALVVLGSDGRSAGQRHRRYILGKGTATKAAAALILAAIMIFAIPAGAGSAATTQPMTASQPKTYYFAWYDSLPQDGMNGDWITLGNLDNATAHVEVFLGAEQFPPFDISPHGKHVVSWANKIGGPVRVISTGGQALAVTQRVIYKNSFNEIAALLYSNLDSSYYFTWYDSLPQDGMNGNWLIVANEDSQTADVQINIGSGNVHDYQINPGQRIHPQFPGSIGGPVHVVSTNGKKIMVSQRVLYKNSFSEVMGYPQRRLDKAYFFSWYDMTGDFSGDWVMMSNPGTSPVHAQLYIGSDPNPKQTYLIKPGQSLTPFFAGQIGGPVRVVCTDCAGGENILVSQRTLYKNSFNEVLGTPPAGLDTEMDYGWYDNRQEDGFSGDWVMIGNQGVGSAAAAVYLGQASQPSDSLTVGEGSSSNSSLAGMPGGPVRVINNGGKPLLSSQRTIYKNSFNELVGLPRAATGELGPATPDLQLLKINTYWASKSDYANRDLSVDFRISNEGQEAGIKATLDSVKTDSGVAVMTSLPESLGDLVGSGGYASFTVKYQIPNGVQSFSTDVRAHCYDNEGNEYYYPAP